MKWPVVMRLVAPGSVQSGSRAVETLAMQRMIQSNKYSQILASLAVVAATVIGSQPVLGQGPMVRQANADFDASGYVTPAGMVQPSMYHGSVQPVGYRDSAPCDSGCGSSGGCDSCGPAGGGGGSGLGNCFGGGGYQSYGGCDSCGGSCGPLGCGGILGKMTSGGDGMSPMRHCCMFCRGGGCSACQFLGKGYLLGALQALRPYCEAGLCAQRWYDFSAEAVFLSHDSGNGNFATTSQGKDTRDLAGNLLTTAPRVLSLGDADSGGDLEAGIRLSAAMILGAGGNLEGTYMGGNKWSSSASVTDPNFQLFSFISSFGSIPDDGFDDTDRSDRQTVQATSEFTSGELNYRRRTVGPYCRFQGSWLVGLRYMEFNNSLGYSTRGALDNTANGDVQRFFSSDDQVENEMFGPQAGFDLWWNMIPGISMGVGLKGAWVRNNIDRSTLLTANSLGANATPGTQTLGLGTHDTTCIVDFETKIAYRLSHSWTFKSAYYLIAVDDAAFSTIDADSVRNFVDPGNNPNSSFDLNTDDLVLQGFSFGAEYIW